MKLKEIFQYGLGAIVIIGFFATLIYMISKEKYVTEVNMIVGALIGAFITIVGYFYGSSKGSADKGELIKKEVNNEN